MYLFLSIVYAFQLLLIFLPSSFSAFNYFFAVQEHTRIVGHKMRHNLARLELLQVIWRPFKTFLFEQKVT